MKITLPSHLKIYLGNLHHISLKYESRYFQQYHHQFPPRPTNDFKRSCTAFEWPPCLNWGIYCFKPCNPFIFGVTKTFIGLTLNCIQDIIIKPIEIQGISWQFLRTIRNSLTIMMVFCMYVWYSACMVWMRILIIRHSFFQPLFFLSRPHYHLQ